MEKLVEKGLCKDIGLSNSNKKQVQDILDACKIKPATLQVSWKPSTGWSLYSPNSNYTPVISFTTP